MRILHIIPSMHMGGAEKFAVDLANELTTEGMNTIYLCSIDKIDETSILAKQVSSKVTLLSLNKTTGYSVAIVLKLYSLLKDIKPDIVHTHLRALTYASFALVVNRVPTIHTIHNLAHKETTKNIQKVHKILFDFFNITPVSISDLVLESTISRYGDQCNVLIYNGVKELSKTEVFETVKKELEGYKNKEGTFVLLNIGRISKQKNQHMLIEAVKEMDDKIVLVIIGALDSEVEYAQQCVEAARGSNNIYFLGLKSNIGDYMFCADVLCLSSLYEGLPLVVLEAMSMGVPILSTPAGGVPDVIDNGINGYISEDFEPESYKAVVQRYLSKPIENSENIQKLYASHYSMKICMAKYYSLYETVLKT